VRGAVDANHTLTHAVGMQGFATENFSATNQGSRLTFEGMPTGTATRVEWATLREGNLGIGTWMAASTLPSSGGTPGGSSSQLHYNSGGSFDGSVKLSPLIQLQAHALVTLIFLIFRHHFVF